MWEFFAILAPVRPLLFALALAVVGCGSAGPKYDYSKEFDPRKHEYVVGPADALTINVWRNGDLSTQAVVRPDGTITLPLIGDMQVAGRTPSQIRDDISSRLAAYIKEESKNVTVAVTGVFSYRFTVTGAVARAGTFASSHYVSVAEAIAMAGGPTRFAETDAVLLLRTDANGKVRKIPIDYDKIQSRQNPDMDLYLVAGDTVFVP